MEDGPLIEVLLLIEKQLTRIADCMETDSAADDLGEPSSKELFRSKEISYAMHNMESVRRAVDKMTSKDREEQRRSFAYGNAKLANPNITREHIEQADISLRGLKVVGEINDG